VFEHFVHVKDQSSSGIGLYLSYQLIKVHKGDINVTDSNYCGAVFIVTIPVSEKDYQNDELFKLVWFYVLYKTNLQPFLVGGFLFSKSSTKFWKNSNN
jgi:hypothetical protein